MIEINLLPQELKLKLDKKNHPAGGDFTYLIPIGGVILILADILLISLNIITNLQFAAINNKWKTLEPQRKIIEDFDREYAKLSQDSKLTQTLIDQRIFWSKKLNKLSLNLPSGIWFYDISISPKEFTLEAAVFSVEKEEMKLIKALIDNLKNDADFFSGFNGIELSSVQKKTVGTYEITEFVLLGNLK